jgi:putative copper resistance protein D
MAGIADFLDSLIGGFDLISYSLTIGGLFWGLFILRPWNNQGIYNAVLLKKTTTLIYQGAFLLAAAQLFKIILNHSHRF